MPERPSLSSVRFSGSWERLASPGSVEEPAKEEEICESASRICREPEIKLPALLLNCKSPSCKSAEPLTRSPAPSFNSSAPLANFPTPWFRSEMASVSFSKSPTISSAPAKSTCMERGIPEIWMPSMEKSRTVADRCRSASFFGMTIQFKAVLFPAAAIMASGARISLLAWLSSEMDTCSI
ncbi:hypothetical protein SDC9_167969 [bioreactor metagenome]|uniref:Uncharacterized protein n=1 Tax=bioreactor metagenome TaxID=1076179 RepID=A0A645G3U7_9ZZZZ